ncbi:MAG: hypothetical protein JNM58_11360 [Xanthomonadaceae bacterium]|nr:hypothetical protein [Xanthomonadaceae bacterium]
MKTELKTRSFRKTPLMAGLVLACGLFTGNSNAQWIVNDPMVNGTSIADMIQNAAEFAEQLNRWNRQVQEYMDALTQVMGIIQNPSLMLANFDTTLTKIPQDHGATLLCPIPTGKSFSFDNPASLFTSMLPTAGDDAVKKQWEYCNQIVRLKNRKYNELVDYVKNAEQRSLEVKDLVNRARADKTEGAWRANMMRAQILMNTQQNEMNFAYAKVEAYDAAIERLEGESNTYASHMLNGDPSKKNFIGQAVSLGALALALEVAD